MQSKELIKIIGCQSTLDLARKISKSLDMEICNTSVVEFSDGEFEPSYDETIRGSHVFLVQSTIPPSENLMELLLMVDAAKRASAYKIIAVIPYFGYARQDKKGRPRVPIGAKLVANLLMAAGVDRIMTMDLHADQIQGFFEVPVDHLYASTLFVPYIQELNLDNLIIASPDMGGTKRANTYAKFLNSQVVVCYKHREKANEISKMMIIGDVKGKNVILVDDMVDTAGTLTKAADLMIDNGAKSVRAVCTHGLFSSNAYERINNSKLSEVVVTDTILKTHSSEKIKVITTAEIFANTIDAVMKKKSITKNFLI
ncbi:MAG: ribose-phosphate pyrophosphokinase [Flavobacteriales bacterium TMED84]|nr:MAG: ribose-phosphate pyrophosphokinase [Flavobacteriales bacterium TMED84]|tara:strand:+ start:1391 stop:2329 length:939 start_codon:yes stop_codon:yes gene_type:complete